jgi:hypothetical protein
MKTASKFGHVFPGWPLAMIFILVFYGLQGQTASWQWAEKFGGSISDFNGGAVDDRPLDMEVDADGNVYIVGLIRAVPEFNDSVYPWYGIGYDVFLCSYDCKGNFRWAQIMGTKNPPDEGDYSIAIDGRGNIYMTGNMNASSGNDYEFHIGDTVIDFDASSAFIAKFKQDDGRFEWVRLIGGYGNLTKLTKGIELFVQNNRIYLPIWTHSGELEPGIQVPLSMVMGIYDTNANYIRHFVIAEPLSSSTINIAGLYLTPDNDLVMGGYLSGKWDFGDTVINLIENTLFMQFDTLGIRQWMFLSGGIYGAGLHGFYIDDDGYIYTAGNGGNGNIFGDDTIKAGQAHGRPMLIKFKKDKVQWLLYPDYVEANTTAYSTTKHNFYSGEVIGKQVWDTMTINSMNGRTDPLFMQADTSGKVIFVTNIPGSADEGDVGRLLASDSVGNVYMSGTFQNELAFGNDTVYNTIGSLTDIFVAKYGTAICVDTPTGIGTMPHKITGKVLLRPNPFTSTAVMQLMLPAGYRPVSRPVVSVYGLTGRWLYSVQMYETGPGIWQAAMHRKGLPAGLYIYQITAGNEAVAQGKFSIQFE